MGAFKQEGWSKGTFIAGEDIEIGDFVTLNVGGTYVTKSAANALALGIAKDGDIRNLGTGSHGLVASGQRITVAMMGVYTMAAEGIISGGDYVTVGADGRAARLAETYASGAATGYDKIVGRNIGAAAASGAGFPMLLCIIK